MRIGPIENHRAKEEGILVYPVYSRRSQGLSVGINLFPDQKHCSFDCPYCEIFPFKTNTLFTLDRMERELGGVLARAPQARDISFSGSGEPTLSPFFPPALDAAFRLRDEYAPEAEVAAITNGAGLLDNRVFDTLVQQASRPRGLRVWLKVDAGTEGWHRAMSRSAVPYSRLRERIKAFAQQAPFIIQTMLCLIQGAPPPEAERRAWEDLVAELALAALSQGRAPPTVHLYSKARPAPEDPLAQSLPASFLAEQAASLTRSLEKQGISLTVLVFP
jgi:histidinol dehydrogenase